MNPNFSVRNVYGDHMVFQRGAPIRIVGTAPAGSPVTLRFASRSLLVRAAADGSWEAEFPAMEAGGPHELVVANTIGSAVTFRDILVGEVWFCSGQSNMEFLVSGDNFFYSLRDGKAVAAAARDDKLRLFHTTHALGPDGPCDAAPAGCAWKVADSPETVAPFSAVGYWFGVFLRQMLGDVPVGMIHASWGGTRIEPWIDLGTYENAGREQELAQAESAKKTGPGEDRAVREAYRAKMMRSFEEWLAKYFATEPAATAEALRNWGRTDLDTSAWSHGTLDALREAKTVGVFWFRREFEIPAAWAGRKVALHFDAVSDCDETFVDGVPVGKTLHDIPDYWSAPRNYPLAGPQAAPGRHVVAIRVMNHYMEGGILGQAWVGVDGSEERIPLREGKWAARCEFKADAARIGVRPDPPCELPGLRDSCQTPTILYNAMVHPFTALRVRGFLWYQGCSNTGAPEDYRNLQPLLIESWRRAFDSPEAAFLITQLSAFHQHTPEQRLPDDFWKALPPAESGYASLREVQDAMRALPNTGVAVTIDIGDHSDIHPANKKDVAYRLVKQAERNCYGCTDVVDGPRYASHVVEGARIRIAFENVQHGLVARGGAVGEHSFAIAGADKRFVWAEAKVEGDTVVVWSPEEPKPVHVRYAWTMFPPNPNLYNAEGFPMAPFRTDR